MTVMVEANHNSIPDLLDGINAVDGFRVEYVEGEISATPSPAHYHECIARSLLRQLIAAGFDYASQAGQGFCKKPGCTDVRIGNHVIPDLWVASRDFTDTEIAASELHKNWMAADALELVVEITSTKPTADLVDKVAAYGRMAIPYYLVADRHRHEAVLFADPTGDKAEPGYATRQSTPFGKPVPLPSPYPMLDTTSWQ